MKNLVWYIAGFSAAAVYFLMRSRPAPVPVKVDELAHKLEQAWADHHTVV